MPNTLDCYHGYPMDVQSERNRPKKKTQGSLQAKVLNEIIFKYTLLVVRVVGPFDGRKWR